MGVPALEAFATLLLGATFHGTCLPLTALLCPNTTTITTASATAKPGAQPSLWRLARLSGGGPSRRVVLGRERGDLPQPVQRARRVRLGVLQVGLRISRRGWVGVGWGGFWARTSRACGRMGFGWGLSRALLGYSRRMHGRAGGAQHEANRGQPRLPRGRLAVPRASRNGHVSAAAHSRCDSHPQPTSCMDGYGPPPHV